MEAEAVGRAIISNDVPGCRATVVNRYNGFLVEFGNISALAEKCIYFIENHKEAVNFGENSRKLAEEKFDENKINEKLIGYIN
jgi:glycosyltransferase involved in cell wall biosynthesis